MTTSTGSYYVRPIQAHLYILKKHTQAGMRLVQILTEIGKVKILMDCLRVVGELLRGKEASTVPVTQNTIRHSTVRAINI